MRTLQAAANNNKCGSTLTWRSASKISNMVIDATSFALRFEAEGPEGELHQYVDHYDDNGLVLKTNQGIVNPMTQHNEPESDGSKRAREALRRTKK